MEMKELAPIILFVYNRIWHTKKTVEALQQNNLANKSELIIYSDGPLNVTDQIETAKIEEVRDYIGTICGFKSVRTIMRKNNYGLANSIITGVTEILKEKTKAIILEDDLVTSPGFLKYMNDALSLYEKNEKVMHISGYMFPVKKRLSSTFFLNTASCWGWATWARAWNHLILDSSFLIKEIYQKNLLEKINIGNSYNHFAQLIANHEGSLKTWAIFWHSTVILNNGYCLHPYPSLVNNIGNDNSGENSRNSNMFTWKRLANEVQVEILELNESVKAQGAIKSFYKRQSQLSISTYLKNQVYFIFNDKPINWFKSIIFSVERREQRSINYLLQYPRYYSGFTDILKRQTKFTDAKSFLFLYKEIFKEDVYKFNSSNESPYILDCGANIGLSIIYFKKIYPKATIVAFEPDNNIFDVLQYNILQSHQLSNIHLVNAALWTHEEGINFVSEGADAGRISNVDASIKVKTCKLSNYLDTPVDYLKMDIEGSEHEVLKECGEKLKNVRQMFIEYHSFEYKTQVLHQILELLSELNFRYYLTMPGLKSSNPLVKLNKYAGMDMQANIYAKNLS